MYQHTHNHAFAHMHLHIYVPANLCNCTHIHTFTHMHLHHICTFTPMHLHTHTHLCTHASAQTCTCTPMQLHTHTHFARMHLNKYMHLHTHAHMYTHEHRYNTRKHGCLRQADGRTFPGVTSFDSHCACLREKLQKKIIIKNWFKPYDLWFYSIVSVSQASSNSYRELFENVAASTAARVQGTIRLAVVKLLEDGVFPFLSVLRGLLLFWTQTSPPSSHLCCGL